MVSKDMEIVLKLYKFEKNNINLTIQRVLLIYKKNQN